MGCSNESLVGEKPRIVFVIGGPGCGKGTQCKRIVQNFKYVSFSTGDLLRQYVKDKKDGYEDIDNQMKEGKLISSATLMKVLKEYVMSSTNKKILVDGYPRNQGKNREERKKAVVRSMQKWGKRYPDAGYGGKFYYWLYEADPLPYHSWGNGSAMRVSSAGWLVDTPEETLAAAVDTAVVTHNHPEGIKGAKATAFVIWAARNGWTKAKIRKHVENEFYPLKQTCNEIRPGYHFDVSCQGTVPQAIHEAMSAPMSIIMMVGCIAMEPA